MCGRFSQGEPSHRISDDFGAHPDDDLPEGLYNVPPTEQIRIVAERDDERRLAAARWGFQPFWADGPGRSWINAGAETAWDSPAFGPALRATRCVIPADGIWSATRHAPPTVAILTTAPNELVGRIHDRMPVILDRDLLEAWLDPATPPSDLAPMLLAAPDVTLRMWPVSTAVNRVQDDGPELLRPIELAPTLGLA